MWKDFDLKGWRYRGMKLNNPALILWKIIWWFPLKFFLALTCLCAWIGFDSDSAKSLWKDGI